MSTYNIIYSNNNRDILYDTYNTVTHILYTAYNISYNIIIHIYTCLMQSLSNDTYNALVNDQFIKDHFTVITFNEYGSLEEEREDRGYCPCCCSPPEE